MEEANDYRGGPRIRFKRVLFKSDAAGAAKTAEIEEDPRQAAARSAVPPPRQRLSRSEERELKERLWPVIKCDPESPWPEPWSLYCVPVRFRQPGTTKKLLNFIDLLIDSVNAAQTLNSYTFFDQHYLYPNLMTVFPMRAADFRVLPAIGVRPEQGPPQFPTQADIEALDGDRALAITEGKKDSLTLQDFFPGAPIGVYVIKQNHAMARKYLIGEGGWSMALSSLDEKRFFETMKQILIKDSADQIMNAIPMVTPLLGLHSFLDGAPADLRQWFGSFELYLSESPREDCLVIASRSDLDDRLPALVEQSRLQEWGAGRW